MSGYPSLVGGTTYMRGGLRRCLPFGVSTIAKFTFSNLSIVDSLTGPCASGNIDSASWFQEHKRADFI